MGRTNPTYRNSLEKMKDQWKSFRRGLRQENKKYFDRFFEDASKHASAASYMNPKNPAVTVFLSAIIQQRKKIEKMENRIEELEEVNTK